MSALFPSFLNLGQRIKRLLATDIKSLWQALDAEQEDGFLLVAVYPYW